MNFILNASALILSAGIFLYLWRSKKHESSAQDEFWAKEHAANSTRRKPLDDLDYIKLPMEDFTMDLLTDVPKKRHREFFYG